MPTYEELGLGRSAVVDRADSRAVFGQVMGLVAVTLGFLALGAYLGRKMSGGAGLLMLVALFGDIIALQVAVRRGREQLAIGLLFGLGLLFGIMLAPVLAAYAKADPGALYRAAGATGGFVAGLGAYGYMTSRDLSSWARPLLFALLGLIAFGLVLLFVNSPSGQIIYSVLGLGVFGAFTIFDFNRLRRATMESSVLIACSIFLDIVNVFLLMLRLFGGGGRN
jgi:FtsH-binding integral membrane protein